MVQGDIRFGRNLNILRSRNNMSQQELADKIHVTRQTISIWERGEGKPDIYYAKDICQIFDVSMDELVCGNVMMPEQPVINEKEYYFESDETDHIKNIKTMGFYTIIDDDINWFFPVAYIDFAKIMVISLALKKQNYDIKEIYENGFSVYIDSDEKALKFSNLLYDIIDSFIHHDDEYIEEKVKFFSEDISDVKCRIIDNVMQEIWGKPVSEYKYYWVDINENPRGYADTKEMCEIQAREQGCVSYEILPIV